MGNVILLIALLAAARGTIIITNPPNTEFANNTVTYFYANFGEVPYGKTLSFDLVVLKNSLCGNSSLDKLIKPT